MNPAELHVGPRGRRLCLEFARHQGGGMREPTELGEALFFAAYDVDPGRGTSRVLFGDGLESSTRPDRSPNDVARLLTDDPLVEPDARALLLALAASVNSARYWQYPDGEDMLAATPELRGPLARVGALIAESSHSGWWATPLEGSAQWEVAFAGTTAAEAARMPAASTLEQWRAAQVSEELSNAERDRPSDPRAGWSGSWWSKPPGGLTRSTRALDGIGPVGLWFVEDAMGWDSATVRQVQVPRDARVYEIDGPEAWADLCRRYPLEVTASRRHDWYLTTARNGRWVIPDWAQVARDFDAVHLTVAGYLTTAGRAIPVDNDRMTVLAGWDPDQTHWLIDVARDESRIRLWLRDDSEGWAVSDADGNEPGANET